MTLLLLFFLSGVLLQGLKILFAHTANQVKDYLDHYNEGAVKLSSAKTNRIKLGAFDFNKFSKARTVEKYAFVTPTNESNNRLNRALSDSVKAEERASDILGRKTFIRPVFSKTA